MPGQGEATRHFNLNWQNDYNLYHAVLGHARDLLRAQPGMTDQALGRSVRDEVAQWCAAAVVEWNASPRTGTVSSSALVRGSWAAQDNISPPLLVLMARDVGDFAQVDVLAVAEEVRYGLGVE